MRGRLGTCGGVSSMFRAAAFVVALVTAGAGGHAAWPAAPQEPQAPVFRSGTELVEVYAIVRDRDGQFVTGLSADDFELLEDNQPHPIQLFYLVNGPARYVPRVKVAEGVPRAEDQTARRLFTLVFDQEHLAFDAFKRVQRAATTFLEEHFRPGDVGGIVVNGAMANNRLTTDREELLGVLRNARPTSEATERDVVFHDWPRLESEFEALRIESGDTRLLQEAVQRNCAERQEECARPGVTEYVENTLQWNAQRYLAESRTAAARLIQTLTVMTAGLGRIEGRKTVVMLTGGFFVEDSRGVLSQIAARAARYGITIYAIDARGLGRVSTGMSDASQSGPRLSTPGVFDTLEDGPFILAADTGGFVINNTNDFGRAFDRIVDDTSTYYVLGYSPNTTAMDGSFRKIDVKVKWKNLSVRARKGYLATPLPPRARARSGGETGLAPLPR